MRIQSHKFKHRQRQRPRWNTISWLWFVGDRCRLESHMTTYLSTISNCTIHRTKSCARKFHSALCVLWILLAVINLLRLRYPHPRCRRHHHYPRLRYHPLRLPSSSSPPCSSSPPSRTPRPTPPRVSPNPSPLPS